MRYELILIEIRDVCHSNHPRVASYSRGRVNMPRNAPSLRRINVGALHICRIPSSILSIVSFAGGTISGILTVALSVQPVRLELSDLDQTKARESRPGSNGDVSAAGTSPAGHVFAKFGFL